MIIKIQTAILIRGQIRTKIIETTSIIQTVPIIMTIRKSIIPIIQIITIRIHEIIRIPEANMKLQQPLVMTVMTQYTRKTLF